MSKIWNKIIDGTSESFSLDKEYSPDWFASIFKYEGKWTFRFGRRPSAGKGEESYTTSQKFSTPAGAKNKALTLLSQKTLLGGKLQLR